MSSSTLQDDPRSMDRHTALVDLLRRYLQGRGPVTLEQIRERYNLPEDQLRHALDELVHRGVAVYGKLTADAVQPQWCDRKNLENLYRRAVARRRHHGVAADHRSYLTFLMLYHQVDPSQRQPVAAGLPRLVQRFRGMVLPVRFFEREILATRLASADGLAAVLREANQLLEEWSRQGRLVWMAAQNATSSRMVRFFPRGEGHLFVDKEALERRAARLSEDGRAVFDCLVRRGASFTRDIWGTTGLSPTRLQAALAELVWAGLVTNDQWGTAERLASLRATSDASEAISSHLGTEPLPDWARKARPLSRRKRAWVRQRGGDSLEISGRWSLVEDVAVLGPELTPSERARGQALLLLERYGILAKEHYRRETGWLPWAQLFRELKRLEWRGEIRRGYFVEGLSGVQFATPEAAEWLRRISSGEEKVSSETVLLSAMDPAVPYGGGVRFEPRTADGSAIPFSRHPSNYLVLAAGSPILYLEAYGQRLWPVGRVSEAELIAGLKMLRWFLQLPAPLRPRRRIEVESWQGRPVDTSPVADLLRALGFEPHGSRFVLWPSQVR